MPYYYFGLENEPRETEGEVLADDKAAHALALVIADELGRFYAANPRIIVYDAEGNVIPPPGGLVIDFKLPPGARH